jgi:hypothetical protein
MGNGKWEMGNDVAISMPFSHLPSPLSHFPFPISHL